MRCSSGCKASKPGRAKPPRHVVLFISWKLNQTPKVTGLFWDLINQEIRTPKVSENDRRRFELSILNLIISPPWWLVVGCIWGMLAPTEPRPEGRDDLCMHCAVAVGELSTCRSMDNNRSSTGHRVAGSRKTWHVIQPVIQWHAVISKRIQW